MKVFLTASYSFKTDPNNTIYPKTLNYVRFKVGQKNLTVSNFDKTSEQKVDIHQTTKAVREDEKAIRNCDAFIADITDSSGGVGFQMAIALTERKPILAIKAKDDRRKISIGPITSGVHKNITYKEYSSEEELTRIIDTFLEEAREKIDTKFILIIPSEIDKYLNWVSDYRRMHKAQVVRNAIEKEIQRDKEWKNYQKRDEF
jgi:hypothetical protein